MIRLMVNLATLAVMLLGCSSSSGEQGQGPPLCAPGERKATAATNLTEEINLGGNGSGLHDPCAGSLTDIRDGAVHTSSSYIGDGAPIPIRWFLDGGWGRLLEGHIVVRGTYKEDTVRCVNKLHVKYPNYTGWNDTIREDGFGEEQCFADIDVHEYIIGEGPPTLTAMVWRAFRWYPATDAEVKESMRALTSALGDGAFHPRVQGVPTGGIDGIESILFLGPAIDISLESWAVYAVWDLERNADDSVMVVHPDRTYWKAEDYETHKPAIEMTLAEFKTAAAAAHTARTTEYGGNIDAGENMPTLVTDANTLHLWYADDDVVHEDGPPTAVPPPACGLAVPDQASNPGLMVDCASLLGLKDELRGTGTLNWGVDTTIADWDGVTTGGTPARVTKVEVDDEDLTGTVPVEVGSLTGLTHLDLSDNSLTGDIPAELGLLSNLVSVKLSGNSLTGCIPIGLQSVATNDLSSLNLLYCRPPAPGAPTAGTVTETSVPLSWTAVANTSTYRVEYKTGTSDIWTVDSETITTTSHTVDGLACGTAHEFRLSAYGSGTTYAAAWSDPSAALTASTGTCVPPVFGATSYSFSVMADAALDAVVGTVSATDTDPVTYAITAGNDDGTFAVGASTGTITVAGALTGQSGTTVTLTVAAQDAVGGEATVEVAVGITGTCDSGTAVPNPTANPQLVADCKTLLGLQSALAGTASLNWSADLDMDSWDGVTLGGTPERVTRLILSREGLTGSIPSSLGRLTGLRDLHLNSNQLTGPLPPELGNLTELRELRSYSNQLTGSIPVELGDLAELREFWSSSNQLTGSIPAELGSLTTLTYLVLDDNALTGPIPAELGGATALQRLWLSGNDLGGVIPAELTELTDLASLLLSGNDLVGCVPVSLKDIGLNDLVSLGLTDCQEGPPAPGGLSVSLAEGVFTLAWTAVSGADEYEVQWRTDAAGAAWATLPAVTAASTTYTPVGGPACSAAYQFRVRAHGDGYTYATHWGTASTAEMVDAPSCPPVFDQDPYTFEVAEDAAVDTEVGTVSATDPDAGDTVTYSITQGNDDGHFAIDASTGAITVAADLDHETDDEYSLMVQASDGQGGTATATVAITVTDVAEDPPQAPTGLTAALAEGVFTLAWDAVDGAGKHETQYTTDAADAATVTWTALAETTETTQTYTPACETTYRFRVRAFGDGQTHIEAWGPASEEAGSVTTPLCRPTGLAATADTNATAIDLSWSAPAGPRTPVGYRIDRRIVVKDGSLDTGWETLIASTGNADTTYTDTGDNGGRPVAWFRLNLVDFTYRVRAIYADDSPSPWSLEVLAVPL